MNSDEVSIDKKKHLTKNYTWQIAGKAAFWVFVSQQFKVSVKCQNCAYNITSVIKSILQGRVLDL